MTPILVLLVLAVVLLVTAVLAMRMRRRLPPPDAHSARYDNLNEQLRLAHAQSIERTAALNRDLEMLRTGREWRGARHDR